ncbi:penicillin-binding protein 1C [Massilia sp. CF038]|uniref:penicillin-binding protein 1C n=1 Tax=Massilia sp. CF038 TaxID=1881045 RepID=UPI00090F6B61|nr:penicillin-binding protein 1C [Massilia sp. CF038]SHH12314.1 penicillin-binding protein 1C [Massilia sp. CF038]
MKQAVIAALLATACAQLAAAPTPAEVKVAYRSSDSVLLDRNGVPLQSLRVDMAVRRLPWVALADISPALGAAVIQAEDQRFATHSGVDLRAIGQAAWDRLLHGSTRGASTITMQLAGLLDDKLRRSAGGRTLSQKWDQAKAARELETVWTKQQIMEAYLNLAPFRGELEGVGAAARGLFGKSPSGLNQAESVILASLLRGPGAAQSVLARRACTLGAELHIPANCKDIEWEVAKALTRPAALAVLAPAPQVAQRLLKGASQQVRSTIDADVQAFAQGAVRQHLAALGERNVNDGAVIAIDNASGEILAYVANGGDNDVDGVLALRQAGSTLKPFLYQLAIERRLLTAASLLDDSPLDVTTVSGLYVPQNYDRQFRGSTSVRTSLGSSLNIPAVRTLLLTGQDRFYDQLHALGFDSLVEPAGFYGPSLALGSAEVSLLALANAYRTLANGGMHGSATLTPRAPEVRQRVLDSGASFIVGDILSDRAARSVTFGLTNELATTFWSAVKTGTSKDMRDNWCVGYTDRYTVAVWVGNFDGRPMWDVSGVTGAAPIWRDVIDHLHRQQPSRAPTAPAGVVHQQLAFEPEVEAPRAEWFMRGTETALVTLVPSAERTPAILYPGEASILAIDPDIPDEVERVVFHAQAGKGLAWRLDGAALGPAQHDFAWRPVAGAHELALVDDGGNVKARTRFQVRGKRN